MSKLKEIRRYHKMKTRKQRWESIFQSIGEYFHTNKQEFQNKYEPGEFLLDHIYDSVGIKSMRQASNGILSLVWKNASESMKIVPSEDIKQNASVKKYFEDMNKEVQEAMDDPKAGLAVALEEFMYDQMSFGTSGVSAFKGSDSDLLYKSLNIEELLIDEGANKQVNRIYTVAEHDIEDLAEEFGEENLSQKLRELLKGEKYDTKVKVLRVIEKREKRDKLKKNNLNMPIKFKAIELESEHVILESGFDEMPAFVSRFYKKSNEIYGRSPAMDALSDVAGINMIQEARAVGIEKALDPPLGVMHDSIMGNGSVDTSARAINVINNKGRAGSTNPIFPLFSVGDIGAATQLVEELTLSIKEHFMLDRFLDSGNNVQMTLGEFNERHRKTAEAMQALFTRLSREIFTPLIERSVSVLFRDRKLGVWAEDANGAIRSDEIPEEVLEVIASGQSFYEIIYITPSERIMKADRLSAITTTLNIAGQVAQFKPEVLDKLNADKILNEIADITGGDLEIFNDDETVQEMRQLREQQQAQQEAAIQAQQEAQLAKEVGEANAVNQSQENA